MANQWNIGCRPYLACWIAFALALALAGAPAAAEDSVPKTSWGAPDMRGTWDFRSITPFERPKEFGDKAFLTVEEVAAWEERTRKARAARAERDPVQGQGDVDGGYNAFWLDRGERMTGTMRTSLVVDPPDGRVPARTEDAQRRSAERLARWGRVPAGPEDRNPLERCIMGFNSGPPMNPGAYNNFAEIFQTPQYVAILNEMVNDHRIIPLDGREHAPESIRLWKGGSRGRWEGRHPRRDNQALHRAHQLPRLRSQHGSGRAVHPEVRGRAAIRVHDH